MSTIIAVIDGSAAARPVRATAQAVAGRLRECVATRLLSRRRSRHDPH
jgi:hypothetical protein